MKLTPAYISSTIPDASTIRSLSFPSKSIAHIEDISFCVNLVRLDLSENVLKSGESLSGLKYCKGITWISVAKNQLTDIYNLTELKNLQGKQNILKY
jgi:Leucine-rich repeat (LRR) protein